MRKLKVGSLAVLFLFSNHAFASDPTPLIVLFLGFFALLCTGSFFIVKILTKNIKSRIIQSLLRVLSITLFFSPASAGGVSYIWPSSMVLLMGEGQEKLYALISIAICTAIGYGIVTIILQEREKKQRLGNQRET